MRFCSFDYLMAFEYFQFVYFRYKYKSKANKSKPMYKIIRKSKNILFQRDETALSIFYLLIINYLYFCSCRIFTLAVSGVFLFPRAGMLGEEK